MHGLQSIVGSRNGCTLKSIWSYLHQSIFTLATRCCDKQGKAPRRPLTERRIEIILRNASLSYGHAQCPMPNAQSVLMFETQIEPFSDKNYLLFIFSQNSKHNALWGQLFHRMDGHWQIRRPFLHLTNMNFSKSASSESSTYSKKALLMEMYVFSAKEIFSKAWGQFWNKLQWGFHDLFQLQIYTCEHFSSMISAGNGFLNKTDESHHFTTYLPSQMLTVKTP